MKMIKFITHTILIAGISLTAIAESAIARTAATYSDRGDDAENVGSIFSLVDRLSDETPINPTDIGMNTVLFENAIEDYIQASFNTIAGGNPVVFNPDGLPVDLGGCEEVLTFSDGSYRDELENPVNFEFDGTGEVTSPNCANTVDSFTRISRANLKVELIENDPSAGNIDTIEYTIVDQTPEMNVLDDLGKLDLSFTAPDFDSNRAINDLSYILDENLLTSTEDFEFFILNIFLEDITTTPSVPESSASIPESSNINGILALALLGTFTLIKRQVN